MRPTQRVRDRVWENIQRLPAVGSAIRFATEFIFNSFLVLGAFYFVLCAWTPTKCLGSLSNVLEMIKQGFLSWNFIYFHFQL